MEDIHGVQNRAWDTQLPSSSLGGPPSTWTRSKPCHLGFYMELSSQRHEQLLT